jgi:hypothetical protein
MSCFIPPELKFFKRTLDGISSLAVSEQGDKSPSKIHETVCRLSSTSISKSQQSSAHGELNSPAQTGLPLNDLISSTPNFVFSFT